MEIKDATTFQSSLPKRQVIIAMAGTMLSMFVGSLYNTIISTAMPRIITDLGGFSQYSWAFTSYFIAQIITIPLAGKLSDMYGRKWFYVIGLSMFVTASFLSGISQTMIQLIVFRGLQGLGFGFMIALSFIVIGDLFPPEERGKYHGVLALVFGLATIIGPTLGGYLTDYLSWRWCFFINIPLGIIIIMLLILFYPKFRPDFMKHRLDYLGVVLLVLAVTPLMMALTWGGVDYGWVSLPILSLLGFSVVMFIIFFIVERRTEEPIIPLELFRNRVVSVSSITVFIFGFVLFVPINFIPLYFQGVLGTSATLSGNFLTPMMFCVALGSVISGQIFSRTSGYYRLQGSIGLLLMAVGLFLISRMTVETSYTTAIINIALVGFGAGIIMPLHTLAVQNSVPYSVIGVATSMISWLRMVGGLFGLSIVGSILNNRFNSEFFGNLPSSVKAVVSTEELASIVDNPQALVNEGAQAQLRNLFENVGTQGAELFEQILSILQNALSFALGQVFIVVFAAAVLGFIANLFLKGITPHKPKKDESMTEAED